MRKSERPGTPVEMMKAQVLMTDTGYPAHITLVRDCYGKGAMPALEPGWFWIGATARSYHDISRRGLHVVGTVTTTFIPPQEPVVVDDRIARKDVPVVGTQDFYDQCHLDTMQRRELVLQSAGIK